MTLPPDEEGGERLRKQSMHLPFTFATGQALSKGKSSRSRKASQRHGGHSQKDAVNPSSLLGAMMQQDKAVYVSHPAPAPNHSFSSSFEDHLEDVSLLDAGRDAGSMSIAPVPLKGASLKEGLVDLQQDCPVLATLDSLSIIGDESCSNNELFSALEGLGLNAEDLELLLLDEKMVLVNRDSEHSPSLNNCFASNEILSYIHATLVSRYEVGQQVYPLPGTSLSPQGGTATYQAHMEDKDSQFLPQPVMQPSVAPGQPPAPLWEQPVPAEEEEEPSDGLQWKPAGEEGLLRFFQPAQGTSWDKAPTSPPGVSCPQEPPGTQQLEGDFTTVGPTQENPCHSFSLPSQGRLIPKKQPSPAPSTSQHPFPGSSAEHFGNVVSPLETPGNSYGTYTLSQESRHKSDSGCVLPSTPVRPPGDHPVLAGSLVPPCQLHPQEEVLPDDPHASSRDCCL
ncbi:PREDICTED: aryl hydrocarbon receptor-like [Chaetura pelagica]|uniref:aryl hydrocarbon receptor-like n=1 Tax=Chaetura pelagica TaxID=8897 RepID=UPI0005230F80|nr:PREDICTED: aryl hydrocarbon receptor-like [Chaetura pelagica]